MQKYEKPDWSLANVEVGTRDIGWAEGVLLDGRPYYLERWQEDGLQLATVYFSPRDLRDQTSSNLFLLLEEAEIIALKQEPLPCDTGLVKDSIGQLVVSINVVLSDPLEQYATLIIPTNEYKK